MSRRRVSSAPRVVGIAFRRATGARVTLPTLDVDRPGTSTNSSYFAGSMVTMH